MFLIPLKRMRYLETWKFVQVKLINSLYWLYFKYKFMKRVRQNMMDINFFVDFPRGEGAGRQPVMWPVFAENSMKTKKFGPRSANGTTGRARLIRSHSSARFCFELSGNSNYIIHCNSNYVQNFELEINSI